jgi:hypothetical protein
MAQNKIVVRYQDGRILKGFTADFLPTRPTFHVEPVDAAAGAKTAAVTVAELKAVFFVKDMNGDPKRTDNPEFQPGKSLVGRKIRVVFKDGETIVGTTQGYDPTRAGFFIVPAADDTNNQRCFVVAAATRQVSFP